ncbi:helix-turn-helix domain-containing protein [Paenibacillus sp. P96]|uniref:Helix-turn-helix domain-containing protein n=1 Tax=Paenibacillus zeirhizosphaerae TaxID=2987519 RepID=A0ABT9FWL7_9BACL|nr:helix-turn-helix transcriptional regulator [Paenibacillus sp. P96]MDP4099126.1 helix-turn-helix domain-containing protein [Paenibacillus sp. P96]
MQDKEILNLVGAQIRSLRKERGLSQEALGEKGGFHFTYIGQIERGEKNVALLNLAKIADALDVNVSQLFAYVHEEIELTETELDIQEIISMLRKSNPDKVRLAKNIVREIADSGSNKMK